jgi:hypothetical protein
MKRVLLLAAVLCFCAPAVFAQFGLGVKFGGLQNKDGLIDYVHDNYGTYTTEESPVFFGIEGLYEAEGLFDMGQSHAFGVKLGIDFLGEDKVTLPGIISTSNIFKIPLTVYYKYKPGKWHLWAGAGITYANTTWEENNAKEDDSALIPHIKGGVEYRFTKVFALGLDLGGNFGGEMKVDGNEIYKRDISGLEGALAARFYF